MRFGNIAGSSVENTAGQYRGPTGRIETLTLVGTVALLVFLGVYALLAMMLAIMLQVSGSKVVELVFYFVGGLAWVVPAGWLVRWMQKPDVQAPAAQAGEQAGTFG